MFKKKSQEEVKDVLLLPKEDRRLLSNAPDKQKIRTNLDRRGNEVLAPDEEKTAYFIQSKFSGIRYQVDFPVDIIVTDLKKIVEKRQVEKK